jgi:hypothetical protein
LSRENLPDVSQVSLNFLNSREITEEKWSGRRGSNPQHPAWESKLQLLYFHNLQNRLRKINVHATHTVHAVPDLRIVAGRLRDGFQMPDLESDETPLLKAGIVVRRQLHVQNILLGESYCFQRVNLRRV